ncbi:YfgM family protein [Ramlibacter rhizophilus]|uniref:Ancillary SecYEG translocon subunit n=1 Tax=Ramlibacter rhizophilus TaxID=1781167 RepID=A0A4Z0BY45_9BURK|nr:tetratricopeptide repeat protein [Ramlibacter rhizophilus]TFZ03218.1 tetratricopeptide repeat protein [Ramlibacter rhizophilus]
MAKHLDLEEQEQLAEIKHFWNKYGNLISTVLIVVFGGIAAFNGWNWWQTRQAGEAAALYEQVEQAAAARETERLQRALADIQKSYGGTTYAQQAALLAAKTLQDAGQVDPARAALAWVADKTSDAGYRSVARLRLAALLTQAKAYDEALQRLAEPMPAAFEPLAADRRGDIYTLQGKTAEAIAQYQKAVAGLDAGSEYRRLVEVKLASLGGEIAKS